MGNQNNQQKPDTYHLNIFTCGDLLNLLLNIQTARSTDYQGHIRYTHPETSWFFTPVLIHEIKNMLQKAIDNQTEDEKNTVIILKTKTIFCEEVYNLIREINESSTLYHPFLLLITEEEESKEELVEKQKKDFKDFDKENLYIIRLIEADIREIYMRLFKISSYYNQLGDEYCFPLSVDFRNMLDSNEEKDEDEVKKPTIPKKVVLFENHFDHQINLLVIGRPGAGKSAFINKVLGEKRCLEKAGKSVTSKILKYNSTRFPIGIYDTPGFETADDMEKTFNLIEKMNKKLLEKQSEIIHMVIYLMNSQDERTLFKTEEAFLKKMLKWIEEEFDKDISITNRRKLPLIFVCTHGVTKQKSEKKKVILSHNLKKFFPEGYQPQIFPVELFEEENLPSFGMGELMQYLHDYFVEDQIGLHIIESLNTTPNSEENSIYSLISHCRLLSKIKSREEIKRFCHYCASAIITSTTSVAIAIGASPIPFADWFLITSIQVSMVVGIGAVYGIQFKKSKALEIIKSLTVVGFGSGICRGIASGIKCIPGIGTITGIVIDSVVSALGTAGIGAATILICETKLMEIGLKDFYLKAIHQYNAAIDSFLFMKERFNY